MPVTTRPGVVSFALKTLTSAVACAVLLSPTVQAAGLGKLTVLSSLGQPLQAEIELTAVGGDEAASLAAKLAPADAFRLANIEFNPALMSLRFAVEQRNGRQIIRVTSSQPINEPFVDMLLELSWSSGRLVREYTFLLDPADLRATQPAQVSAPQDLPMLPAGAPTPSQVQAALADARAERASRNAAAAAEKSGARPAPATPVPAPARTPEPLASQAPRMPEPAAAPPVPTVRTTPTPPVAAKAAPKADAKGDYRVKSGDTLSRIAGQLKPADVSLDAMLVALYRANPDAFSGNNMNRLKSGQILALPDAETLRAAGAAGATEARGVVVAHALDFASYRNKLAGQVALSTPAKTTEAGQSATGKISAKVEERATPANESKDQLKLSKAAPAAPVAGKTAVAGVEDKIAKEKQVAEAAARVKELEKNVGDLEKLMAVKSQAALDQKKAEAAASAAAPKVAPPVVAPAVTPDVTPAVTPSVTPVLTPPAEAPVVAEAPKPKPLKKLVLPPPAEPSVMDTVMENISSIGIALAALLAGGLLLARRRKQAPPKAASGLTPVPVEPVHSMFAETGGQSVDTNNSVFNSNFAPSASQLDTNEVDPVAEADVYIAYGRDAQAEEILKEALRTHPERHPVRLKLLEIYAARKDARAFETQAGELYSMTRGDGDEWRQAAALGQSIDPLNPLYAGATPASAPGFGAALAAATAGAAAGAAAVSLAKPEPDAADEDDDGLVVDLNQGSGASKYFGADAAQETALPVPVPATPAAESDNFLDFDLGGLTFEPVSSSSPIAMPGPVPASDVAPQPEPAPAAAAAAAPDFDLAFDLPFDPPAKPATPAAPSPAPAAPVDLDAGMDFGLDLPSEFAPETPSKAAPEVTPAAAEAITLAPLPDPLMDLDLMDFDPPAPTPSSVKAGDRSADDILLDDFFNTPPAAGTLAAKAAEDAAARATIDGATKNGADAAAKAAADDTALPEFDLTGIDLDLLGADAAPASTAAAPAAAAPAPAAGFDGVVDDKQSAIYMEMDTKLDLALAYQEIGDKEGARELIDEVIKGGSDDQVEKAHNMRALLG